MLPIILDEDLVAALFEMGGESLRAQLLEDLCRCEAQLTALCTITPTDAAGSPKRVHHVLHELRGIALTIGAQKLAQNCAEAEALAMTTLCAEMAPRLAQAVHDSREVRARLLLSSGGPA